MEPTFIKSIIKILKGRSIFLIGMMGCGKSKTGPQLAKSLNYKFVDLDSLIEKASKMTISNIFSNYGENQFREIETRCLQEVIQYPKLVISTGGGIVTKIENWGILRQGVIIWIDLKKEIAIKRLRSDIDNRPLLMGKNLEKEYEKIFKSRKNLYSQADLKIEIENENVQEVNEKILSQIKKEIESN